MAALVASAPVALLYHPKLCQSSLGEVLHAVLHSVHSVDRHLLLLHGVDGEYIWHCEAGNVVKHLVYIRIMGLDSYVVQIKSSEVKKDHIIIM